MRFPRVKAPGHGFYHCISRVVDGRFIFDTSPQGSLEAERFIRLMRCLEAFSGVRVLTYALMANHFHLLCELPEPEALSEAQVLERIEAGYGPVRLAAVKEQLAGYRRQADATQQRQRLLDGYRKRMLTSRSLSKSSKADSPSGITGVRLATGSCGLSALRVCWSMGDGPWRRWLLTSNSTRCGQGCVGIPKIIATVATRRLLPRALRWPARGSEPFWLSRRASAGSNSKSNIAAISLRGAAWALEIKRRLLLRLLSSGLSTSSRANYPWLNSCFAGCGFSPTE